MPLRIPTLLAALWLALAPALPACAQGAAAPAPPQAGERTTNWSTWGRKSGLHYRYRIRWSPQARPPAQLHVSYEVRNSRARPWHGAVRALDCDADTVIRSTRVVLAPNAGGEFRLVTPNCGSTDRPSFRPDVTESVRID